METLLNMLIGSAGTDEIIKQLNAILEEISGNIYNQAVYLESLSGKVDNLLLWVLCLGIVSGLSLAVCTILAYRINKLEARIDELLKR